MTSPSLWRQILRTNFTSWLELSDFLQLSKEQRQHIDPHPAFSLNLPRRLAAKAAKKTLDDPILRQFLPMAEEKKHSLGFVSDPVGDRLCSRTSKLLHKYQGRALLVCTSACAMHCRYCFRQQFDYDTDHPGFTAEIQLIRQDPSIHEVILSGGDPLSLSDGTLDALLTEITAIPHVHRIRFHTRFPIGIPERIDADFLHMLEKIPKQVWFIVHINHPNECDPDVLSALKKIQKLGIPVCNQAVLLKGVNDNVETLARLCELLIDHGILPYYLHQLDRVQGTAHFEVPENQGLELIKELSSRLSGYGVPKYVREIAGQPAKTPILMKDFFGEAHG